MADRKDWREPFDFISAVAAHRQASEAQHHAEQYLAAKGRESAEAERLYREALSRKIVELMADGRPATVARDLARGDKTVAELKMRAQVAQGLVDAAAQSIWRHTADRRDLEQFLDWSKRAAFLDTHEAVRPQGLSGVR